MSRSTFLVLTLVATPVSSPTALGGDWFINQEAILEESAPQVYAWLGWSVSVSGDVANNHSKMVFRCAGAPQKVKVVPADFIAGHISSCDIQTVYQRALVGKQISLDFPSEGHSLLVFGHIGDKRHVTDNGATIVPKHIAVN